MNCSTAAAYSLAYFCQVLDHNRTTRGNKIRCRSSNNQRVMLIGHNVTIAVHYVPLRLAHIYNVENQVKCEQQDRNKLQIQLALRQGVLMLIITEFMCIRQNGQIKTLVENHFNQVSNTGYLRNGPKEKNIEIRKVKMVCPK